MTDRKEMLAPQIRFKGYTNAWGLCRLGEVSTYSNGGSYENDVKEFGHYELITLKSVDMNGNLVSSNKFIDIDAPTLKQGTLVMILSEQSPGLLGMTAIIPKSNKFVLNQRVAEIAPSQDMNNYYLSMQINKNQVYFSKIGAGTKVQNISKPNVENFAFYCPNLPEQTAIGNFFRTLDTSIDIQKRKCESLRKLKAAYLQQMFPQNGESVPRVRFSGFSDNWNEKKLSEVLLERNIQQLPSETIPLVSFTVESGVTPKSNRYNREFLVKEEQKKYKYTKTDDIVYNPANLKFGAIARNKYGDAVFSPIYVTFEVNDIALPSFIEMVVTDQDFIKRSLVFQEGTVYERMAVKPEDFLSLSICLPSLEEQAIIGKFFNNLDVQIIAMQTKLDKLKQLKQAYLQKMFV